MPRFIHLIAVAAFAVSLQSASRLGAQDAAPTPALTPPVLRVPSPPEYPPQALAEQLEASVELELDLDASGAVSDARVVVPAGHGFDEAAVQAARKLVFEPAKRGDEAIAARIRYRYTFTPPEPAASPAPAPSARIAVTVRRQGQDTPLHGADVLVRSQQGSFETATVTDAEGRFAIDALPAGRYEVRITALGFAPVTHTEELSEGEALELTYRLLATQAEDRSQFGAVARIEAPPREVVQRSITQRELTRVAGTRGDALRTVELLPGVARPPSGAGVLVVRGSAPNDSEVFFDGASVLNLYHFGGLTSIANGQLLSAIDFYPGNFSTRYGRRIGGVVEASFRDPRSDGLHGVVDINVIDASALVEAPITDDLAIAIALRRSYIDTWFAAAVDSGAIDVVAAPVYYDYQLLATYHAGARDTLRLRAYGSYDEMSLLLQEASDSDPALRGEASTSSTFHRAQLAWEHDYSETLEGEISVAVGPVAFEQRIGPRVGMEVDAIETTSRAEWRWAALPELRLRTGFDVYDIRGSVDYVGPRAQQSEGDPSQMSPLSGRDQTSVDIAPAYLRPAFYAETEAQLSDRLLVTPGVRIDYFGDIEAFSVDPRLTSRYVLGDTTLRGGVGSFSQAPHFVESAPELGNPELGPLHAWHFGAGVEQRLTQRVSVSLDGFYKHLRDLVVNGEEPGTLKNGGKGRIYGAELAARVKPGGAFFGMLSYTLSRSERNDDGSRWRLFDYDQTHILTLAGNYDLGSGWELGATFRLVSGNPETPITGSIYDAGTDLYTPIYGRVNSARNPAFHRLDVRIAKTWAIGDGKLTAYVDAQNAYNQRNREGTSHNYDYTQTGDVPGLPIIPSLGLRGEL